MTTPTPPTPVPTTNAAGQDAVTVLENLANLGETAAEAAIIAAVPAMGVPVWKQIWEAIFDWIVTLISAPIASLGGRIVIDVQEYVALKTAVTAQVALDTAKKTGDSHAVAQASQNVDTAVAGVIRYVGAIHS